MGLDLHVFLDSYTCDTVDIIYELAEKEGKIVSIYNRLIEIDEHKFRETYLVDAAERFRVTLSKMLTLDLKVYDSYKEFYMAYYTERFSKEELIEMMYSDCTEPPDDEYVILDNGQVIHINS